MYGENNGKGAVKLNETLYSYQGDPAWAWEIVRGLRYHYRVNATYVPQVQTNGEISHTIILWSVVYGGGPKIEGGQVIQRRDMAMLEAFCIGVVYALGTAALNLAQLELEVNDAY